YQDIGGRRTAVPVSFQVQPSPRAAKPAPGEPFVYGFEVGAYDRDYALVIDPVLSYSTYLGGTGTDDGLDVSVQPGGTVFVTGGTDSADFDTTVGAYDTTANGGRDAFVSKFNIKQSGAASLVFSTYIGGSNLDEGTGIAVRSSTGEIYVTCNTSGGGFPTTAVAYNSAYSGSGDTFVARLNAAGSSLLYSTYLD